MGDLDRTVNRLLIFFTTIQDLMPNQQVVIIRGGVNGDLIETAIIFISGIFKEGVFTGSFECAIIVQVIPNLFALT